MVVIAICNDINGIEITNKTNEINSY